MKQVICLILCFFSLQFVQSQALVDTLSPEKQVRRAITRIRGNSQQTSSEDLNKAFSAMTDMAARRIPFLTTRELRNGMADTARVVYVNQSLRSGTFQFDPNNTTSVDDSSMIIVAGKRRYVREDLGYLRPEWFGADPNDKVDDAAAIQKMFNQATSKGLSIRFSNGIYYIGSTITFKLVSQAPKFYNKLNIEGEGVGRTSFYGVAGFKGDMFEVNTGDSATLGKDNYITIRGIEFRGQECNRLLFFPQVTSIKLYDNMFMGGTDCGIQFGMNGGTAAYSVYMKNNYHHGATFNGGHNNALLRLISARFFVIEGMETDGGKYGIEMIGSSDNNIITNCKIEGSKKAAVYIDGRGGGKNMIYSNTFNPYIGHEPNARFNGQIHAVEIVAQGGSNSYNKIFGNNFFVESSTSLPLAGKVTNVKGPLRTAAGGFTITGQTSKAVAQLNGYNPETGDVVMYVASGTFKEGETLVQSNSKATAVLSTVKPKSSYCVKLTGGGGNNIVSGNITRLFSDYGVYSTSNNNIISNNAIECLNGVYSEGNIIVSENNIFSKGGNALNRVSGEFVAIGNRITGGNSVNVDDYYLKTSGGTVNGELNLSGATTKTKNIEVGGNITVANLPVYADNAAATKGGLVKGSLYRTQTGELRVKF